MACECWPHLEAHLPETHTFSTLVAPAQSPTHRCSRRGTGPSPTTQIVRLPGRRCAPGSLHSVPLCRRLMYIAPHQSLSASLCSFLFCSFSPLFFLLSSTFPPFPASPPSPSRAPVWQIASAPTPVLPHFAVLPIAQPCGGLLRAKTEKWPHILQTNSPSAVAASWQPVGPGKEEQQVFLIVSIHLLISWDSDYLFPSTSSYAPPSLFSLGPLLPNLKCLFVSAA